MSGTWNGLKLAARRSAKTQNRFEVVLVVAISKSMARMLIKNYKQISPPTKQSAELTCRI